MTLDQIKELVAGPDYDFLRTNEHLRNRIVLLALGGSHAYGTNIETSDVDIRGCALNRAADLIGLSNFEQVIHLKTDTSIFSFKKLINLLLNCNPNTIEILGCKPEHYLVLTDIGKELIANRKMFLSQRAFYSFGGYAKQQLHRMENALAKRELSQEGKDDAHLNKLAMHLIRLYGMCLDILEKEEVITYREEEHDLLMSIRLGAYQLEDGTYRQEFFDLVNEYEIRMKYAVENTSLPKHPNIKRMEEFVMNVNRKSLDMA